MSYSFEIRPMTHYAGHWALWAFCRDISLLIKQSLCQITKTVRRLSILPTARPNSSQMCSMGFRTGWSSWRCPVVEEKCLQFWHQYEIDLWLMSTVLIGLRWTIGRNSKKYHTMKVNIWLCIIRLNFLDISAISQRGQSEWNDCILSSNITFCKNVAVITYHTYMPYIVCKNWKIRGMTNFFPTVYDHLWRIYASVN